MWTFFLLSPFSREMCLMAYLQISRIREMHRTQKSYQPNQQRYTPDIHQGIHLIYTKYTPEYLHRRTPCGDPTLLIKFQRSHVLHFPLNSGFYPQFQIRPTRVSDSLRFSLPGLCCDQMSQEFLCLQILPRLMFCFTARLAFTVCL